MTLSRKLTLATAAFAALVSLAIGGIELWRKHVAELHNIDKQFAQIESSSVPPIAETVWSMNRLGAELIAEGIARHPDVARVTITSADETIVDLGQAVPGAVIREFALRRPPRSAQKISDERLGWLAVAIDQQSIERRLLAESASRFFGNLLLIVLIAGFVLALLERRVMRHMRHVASHVDQLTPTNLNQHLVLERSKPGDADELQTLVQGISGMQESLRTAILTLEKDISERQRVEAELRIAATAFESGQAILVTDAAGTILRANHAFSASTGYSADEVIGKNPRLLKSGRHDAEFYRNIWDELLKQGSWHGEIWDKRKNGEIYPKWLSISSVKGEAGQVTHYVGTSLDLTERKRTEALINELAYFDPLSGLPNRSLLIDRLGQATAASARNGDYGALIFLDLDNFKTLNDTLGHDIGDLLLKEVAIRLSKCVRESDTVARLGGDEFVLILSNLSEDRDDAAKAAETVADKVLAALNQTYQLGYATHHSGASLGVTLFHGSTLTNDELMKQADLAMYRAKDAGRNTMCFFDPAMEESVKARAALEIALREALNSNQFELHYQPQVVGNGQLTGAEALIRWRHPSRGMVSPADFIPLAEETGLIQCLGHWVLHTGCRQLALWAKQKDMAHLTLAVNVSAEEFRQANFVEQVLAVLHNTGARADRLKLELTESLLVDNIQDIIEKMFALKAKGVCFSLDDFGTGYSSLSYLKRLPLDQLKIDQSFVRDVLSDPNDTAIARTVVALAQNLGLGVIAEGVETEKQRDFLADCGCQAYQGYYFSRPLPIEDFEAYAQRS